MNPAAVLSMIHESPERNSAARLFRTQPVLWWTLERLSFAQHLGSITVLCWEDQLPHVEPIAAEQGAYVLAKGPRVPLPQVEAISAARRWADGWRGGLLSTCEFDRGAHLPWLHEIARKLDADGVIIVDPSAGLVDPMLIEGLISHATEHADQELLFSPAAPGLSGVLLRPGLIERLAKAGLNPGMLLNYLPDQPSLDPISQKNCAPVPMPVARTTRRFTLDSDRQVSRISHATVSLNGQLVKTEAEALVHTMQAWDAPDEFPREVVLEINTERATAPNWWPGKHLSIRREPMTPAMAQTLFRQMAASDDVRLTIAGVGDPMLSPHAIDLITAAQDAGIGRIHLETDLLCDAATVAKLVDSRIDVVSVHLPALSPATYQKVMGVDGYTAAFGNIRSFLEHRASLKSGVPLIVPVFTKVAENLAEMESWYDQWLRALRHAVIAGPTDYAGQIPFTGVADMSPPKRRPCARLQSRMTVLCDGSIVSCEQDVLGKQKLGSIATDQIQDVWQHRFGQLRTDHAAGALANRPLCAGCREWHRP